MYNPFIQPTDYYKRDLNIIAGYRNDTALYLSIMTGSPIEECEQYVTQQVHPETGATPMVSPQSLVLVRNEHGDREKKIMGFMQFINTVEKRNLKLSPSMAAYVPEEVKEPTHAAYIAEGVSNRSLYKHKKFEAQQAGNVDLTITYNGIQENLKGNNNSYSGATVSSATILYYKSTHSALTSTCRAATSYANANNEKFLMGNRHYYTSEIVKANLLSIINLSDLALMEEVMQKYQLHYPTPEEVMKMVEKNSVRYWSNPMQMTLLNTLVTRMTPLQRAAVMYVGDFHHLYVYNPVFIRNFVDQLSALGDFERPVEKSVYKGIDGDTKMLAQFLCYDQMRGRKLEDLETEEPATYNLVKSTAVNVIETLCQFESFIKVFLMSRSMPSSIHAFPSIVREAVPVSDTDSTMFTCMWWIEQFYGDIVFTPASRRTTFTLVYLISNAVAHILALLSKNMGVSEKEMRKLAMKNEYYFELLFLTTRSKHYWASRDAQEGLMFMRHQLEVKGVGLRDSKVYPLIQQWAKDLMDEMIDTLRAGEKLDMLDILTRIANIERGIKQSLLEGKSEYLNTVQVKGKDSYREKEENSTYKQWLIWENVFMPAYDKCPPPPYLAMKVSLDVNNRTDIANWGKAMNNPAMAERLHEWMAREERKDLTTLFIPMTIIETHGIPKEIACAIDTRKVIANTMGTFYLMLETLGIFLLEKNNIRLVSDYY